MQIRIAKGEAPPFINIDDFSLAPDKITFLFGESGIGKSMLSRAVYGLLDPLQLNIRIDDLSYPTYLEIPETRAIQQNGFFVFQEPSSHLNPLLRLGEQLREGSLAESVDEGAILRHLWASEDDGPVRDILKVYPKSHRPSGGEKQRILLAMAFKKMRRRIREDKAGPAMFVFDEPTGSLDNHFRNRFLNILMDCYRRKPATILLITHDYSMISEIFRSYPDLEENICFRELVRDGQQLKLNDFQPRAYLNWLAQTNAQADVPTSHDRRVLRMDSGYRVFNRGMEIRRDGKTVPLEIYKGEMVYLKAASGVGKTTLAKVVMGLLPCQNLSLEIGPHQFSDKTPRGQWRKKIWGKHIGMVFQHADEALNLKASVREAFQGLPLPGPLSDEEIRRRLRELFDLQVDEQFLNKPIARLSGGQKQRVNLLRTLLLETDLLILDEPLNGLDFDSIRRVIDLLYARQKAGTAILMISHNEEIFDALVPADQVFHLQLAG